jgi:LytS/YehU family sensor histidine kinase
MKIDRNTLLAKVPSLILQPIVENAIRHGIASRNAGGVVSLSASRNSNSLRINVYNDGPTLPPDWRIEDCNGIDPGDVVPGQALVIPRVA